MLIMTTGVSYLWIIFPWVNADV